MEVTRRLSLEPWAPCCRDEPCNPSPVLSLLVWCSPRGEFLPLSLPTCYTYISPTMVPENACFRILAKASRQCSEYVHTIFATAMLPNFLQITKYIHGREPTELEQAGGDMTGMIAIRARIELPVEAGKHPSVELSG